MPQNITDVDAFTDPIVIPADSDPANLVYVQTLAQGLANRTRHNKNAHDSLEAFTGESIAASRGAYLHALAGASGWDGIDNEPGWALTMNGASSQGSGLSPFHWAVMGGGPLPSSCTITAVRVFLKPGAARSGTDRMRLRVYRMAASGLVLTSIGDVYDDETALLQTLAVTGLSIPLTNDESTVYGLTNLGVIVRIDPGNDATPDSAYLCEVRYTTVIL